MILKSHHIKTPLFLILMLPVFVMAQTSEDQVVQPRSFKEADWQRAKEGIDYSADVQKEAKKKAKSTKGDKGKDKSSSPILEGGNASGIMKIIIIAIAAIVLILLIRSLLGLKNPKDKKFTNQISFTKLTEIEDNIHEANLDDFIRQAVAQQNFALAIRLYYLAILKELSLRNIIAWKKDKTNKDYLREMRQSAFFASFQDTTALFERIWYGDSPINAPEFQRLEPQFRALVNQINTISTPVAK